MALPCNHAQREDALGSPRLYAKSAAQASTQRRRFCAFRLALMAFLRIQSGRCLAPYRQEALEDRHRRRYAQEAVGWPELTNGLLTSRDR